MKANRVNFESCEIEVTKVSMKQAYKVRKMKKEKSKYN